MSSPHPSNEALGGYVRGELDAAAEAEIDTHIESCPECLAAMDRLADGGAGHFDLPNYEVLGPVGSGGMGTVLRVRDRSLRRELALKTIRPQFMASREARERFLEEAHVAGRLQHPGLVPVHELGELPDGRPYFVMKLVRGHDLAEVLAGRADPSDGQPGLIRAFGQACEAVAYAHSRGVIHRDLKPANVMIGEFGEVQVMDWGLAKVLGGEGVLLTPRSEGGAVRTDAALGTYPYMPPEQARGDADDVDRRSDVFGLGAILCEILTGLPPYTGPTREDARDQAAGGRTAPALERLMRPGVDSALAGLCAACLAAGRDDRPADAGAVAGAVARIQADAEERVRRERAERERAELLLREGRRRRRWQAGLGLAALVLTAIGVIYMIRRSQLRETTQQGLDGQLAHARRSWSLPDRRAAEAELARVEALLENGGPDDLIELAAARRADLILIESLDGVRARRLGGSPVLDEASLAGPVESGVLYTFDSSSALAEYPAAFRDAGYADILTGEPREVAAGIRASSVGPAVVAAMEDWALAAHESGRGETADRLLELCRLCDPGSGLRDRLRDRSLWGRPDELIRLAEEIDVREASPQALLILGGKLPITEGAALLRRALIHRPGDYHLNFQLGQTLADESGAEAVAPLRAALALRPDSAEARLMLADALGRSGELNEALALCREAVRSHPNYFRAHSQLGSLLTMARQPSAAARALARATELRPDDPVSQFNLGMSLLRMGKKRQAATAFAAACRGRPAFAVAWSNLGVCHFQMGDFAAAESAFRAALAAWPGDPKARLNLGNAFMMQGKPAAAEPCYRRAADLAPDDAAAHIYLGYSLLSQRKPAEAVAPLRRGVRLAPRDHQARLNLAGALRKGGRLAEAADAYGDALRLRPADHHSLVGLVACHAMRAGWPGVTAP